MPQHTREQVRDYILNNLDETVDMIQSMLTLPGVCEDDCEECWLVNLCVEEGTLAEEVTDGTDEAVPDGQDKGTSIPVSPP